MIIDRLGFYKDRDGDVTRIFNILDKPNSAGYIAEGVEVTEIGVDYDDEVADGASYFFTRTGKWDADEEHGHFDLVEYLSPEKYPEMYI